MKSIKQLLFIGLGLMIIFNSCSIEKRKYLSGYNIEWKSGKNLPGKVNSASTDKIRKSDATKTVATRVVNEETPDFSASTETASASGDNSIAASVPKSFFTQPRAKIAATTVGAEVQTKEVFAKNDKAKAKKYKEANKDKKSRHGSKSQLIALILCAFVGGIGIHRFYLGYIWQGVVQLLTAGGCGVWALIDLIRIITGDLEPKDGSYDSTL